MYTYQTNSVGNTKWAEWFSSFCIIFLNAIYIPIPKFLFCVREHQKSWSKSFHCYILWHWQGKQELPHEYILVWVCIVTAVCLQYKSHTFNYSHLTQEYLFLFFRQWDTKKTAADISLPSHRDRQQAKWIGGERIQNLFCIYIKKWQIAAKCHVSYNLQISLSLSLTSSKSQVEQLRTSK